MAKAINIELGLKCFGIFNLGTGESGSNPAANYKAQLTALSNHCLSNLAHRVAVIRCNKCIRGDGDIDSGKSVDGLLQLVKERGKRKRH